ncbi:MAG: acetate/propionate family kinase [Frankiaceae bacterium]
MTSGSGRPEPVLVLNCGSSSVKFAVLDPQTGRSWLGGLVERVGTPDARMTSSRNGQTRMETPTDTSYSGVLRAILGHLADLGDLSLLGVGHRVVHGGERFTESVVIDDDVLSAIRGTSHLAPLHNPANLEGIGAARAVLPGVPQVAVFDTAFHHSMPRHAYHYAIPRTWYLEHGVRRYGFHGTSHRYVAEHAAQLLGRPLDDLRLVTAHLGNGCSATAVRDGRSVDTSMGLTPLEGLVMGTRSGDLDPGVFEYLAERLDTDVHALTRTLNSESGLLGLSGVSNDMRTLTALGADGGERGGAARFAIDVFCYRLAKYVAALVVPLGRLDALVFTGGIGEHSVGVRSSVLGHLGFLGLFEDPEANAAHGRGSDGRISRPGPAQALVVPTNEELVIARDTARLVAGQSADRAG